MATPFALVYELFLQQIADYEFAKLAPEDMEYNMERWLRAAITKFSFDCRANLGDRDMTLKQFNANLTELEQQILANQMVVEWLSPKIRTSELIKQSMSDKDFKLYSQANHLEQIRSMRNEAQEEVDSLITRYTYMVDSLGESK